MADALVSPLLEQITTILSQQAQEEVTLVVGVEKEIQKLNGNLLAVQAVLQDAERRRIKEVAVKDWLNKLKHVCYDMDDVLDEWSTAIHKWQKDQEAENEPDPAPKKTVWSFFRSLCFCFSQLIQRHDIALKIKEVSERLDVIVEERAKYGFQLYRATEEPQQLSRNTTSFVDVSSVYGRDDDKKHVVCKLLGSSSQETGKVQAICIEGMGGIGKTTLAQLAYNDDEVKANFDKRIWVCVSDPFDEFTIAKAIVESLSGASPDLDRLQSLLERISELIEGKKFLLVLDDVWSEDHIKWEPLKRALNHGAHGSRILVTTRKEGVANMTGSASLIHLSELSTKECWSIFSQVAFHQRSNDECERLTEIGKKISGKCKGLPLAAKVLGGLMQSKRTRGEWENVLSSELWGIEEVERGLSPPLLLSYNDLPPAIRQCFTYCALFPKDSKLEKNELIRMWMAQGFLKPTPSKEMEVVGAECFEILAFRAFFQNFQHQYRTEYVMMHDIVHDFALFLMKNGNFIVDVNEIRDPEVESYEKVRHLSISVSMEAPSTVSIDKAKSLRSLFVNTKDPSVGAALPELFNKLTCLRSLNLKGYPVKEIPSEIGKLMHLRYLNFAGCSYLMSLPETISNLCNLQSLDLSCCISLCKLPQGAIELAKLRHLVIFGSSIAFLPKGIKRLVSLRTLSYFNLCGDGGNQNEAANIGEIKHMNYLGGYLVIRNLQCVADLSEAVTAELKSKKLLIGLMLDFEWMGTCSQVNEDALLEALQPPSGLETLSIVGYRGTFLPSWMLSLSMLRDLTFSFCRNIEVLPPLGRLPYLETLEINSSNMIRKLDAAGFLGIETVDKANDGKSKQEEEMTLVTAFPRLKKLTLMYLEDLEEWEEIVSCRPEEKDFPKKIIMPQLRELTIIGCPKLKALPDYILAALLEMSKITRSPILKERYTVGAGEDSLKISHIRKIDIGFKVTKWMHSSKVSTGRLLNDTHVFYDIDVRLQGEIQSELEATTITKYSSNPDLVLGHQIAVNRKYICYGLKPGAIRILNIDTALRSLLRGHNQKVTDMAFFAEDVHLLASACAGGRVFIRKINEAPYDEGEEPQIFERILLALEIIAEGESAAHPRVSWHPHKQEILMVAIGRWILKIDTNKVGKGRGFLAEQPLACSIEKLIDGINLVGKHDGEVTELSMCQWMTTRLASASTDGTVKIWEDCKTVPLAVLRPHDGHPVNSVAFLMASHRPDHIVLITGGPLNQEVKIWASASEGGWLLPGDAESWQCTQTLTLKSSAESKAEDAFFNQAVALPRAGLFLLANARKSAVYAVHIEYGPYPAATRMDYIAEFTVTLPILSLTGTSDGLRFGEDIVQVYCVQTQAIQQYELNLSQCLPPPVEKTESSCSRAFDAANLCYSADSSPVSRHDTDTRTGSEYDSPRSIPPP